MKISRAIKKHCRELASELVQREYELYDQIWTERIRITPALFEHGEHTVRTINKAMPNLLVHSVSHCAIDEIVDMYGFESTSALIDFLLAYTPRKPIFDRYYSELLESNVSPDSEIEIDTVPF